MHPCPWKGGWNRVTFKPRPLYDLGDTTHHHSGHFDTGFIALHLPPSGQGRPGRWGWGLLAQAQLQGQSRDRLSSQAQACSPAGGGAAASSAHGHCTGTRRTPSAASWSPRRPCSQSLPAAFWTPWLHLRERHNPRMVSVGRDLEIIQSNPPCPGRVTQSR